MKGIGLSLLIGFVLGIIGGGFNILLNGGANNGERK